MENDVCFHKCWFPLFPRIRSVRTGCACSSILRVTSVSSAHSLRATRPWRLSASADAWPPPPLVFFSLAKRKLNRAIANPPFRFALTSVASCTMIASDQTATATTCCTPTTCCTRLSANCTPPNACRLLAPSALAGECTPASDREAETQAETCPHFRRRFAFPDAELGRGHAVSRVS